MPLRHVGGVEI